MGAMQNVANYDVDVGQSAKNKLFLVPTPLDFGCDSQTPLDDALPMGTLRQAASLTLWVCENAKSLRAFLKRVDAVVPLAQPLQSLVITELPREVHKKGDHLASVAGGFDAKPLLHGGLFDVGLASEAGMPCVADPGASVVRAAAALGMQITPLVGPSSLLLALAASGLNGQNFAFVGYVPQDAGARTARLRELEALAQRTGQTQMFIETPYRNGALWSALMSALKPATRVGLAAGVGLAAAVHSTQTVEQWRRRPPAAAELKLPAIFLLGAVG